MRYGLSNMKDQDQEARLFFHRTIIMLAGISLLCIFIVARLIQLQVIKYPEYQTQSKTNYLKIEPDAPIRGLIYDRHKRLLATNKTVYTLEITPEEVDCPKGRKRRDCVGLLLKRLQTYYRLELDEKDFENFFKGYYSYRRKAYEGVPIKRNLTERERDFIAVRRHEAELSGVEIVPRIVRHYPYTNSLAHVLGYVRHMGERDEQVMTDAEKENYAGTTHIGIKGIEKQYEKLMHGTVGVQQVERNARGRTKGRKLIKASIPGRNIYLTLDLDLQMLADKLLEGKKGAIVALDPNNGEVLALVSSPSFDPNEFVHGISRQKYAELRERHITDYRRRKRPLYPRAVLGAYTPGSTIKPFYGLAGLHYKIIKPQNKVRCIGYFTLPGVKHRWRDWKPKGHGIVDLNKSIKKSCDVYYYTLAVKMRIKRISEFLGWFGFGQKTGIDLPREAVAILPSIEWKKRRFKRRIQQKWFTGDTVSVGIGQGYITVTPMQLAVATAALANRGKIVKPRLLYAQQAPGSSRLVYRDPEFRRTMNFIKPEHFEQIVDDMVSVVHNWGTATRIRNYPEGKYKIGGKTGTAQVFTVSQKQKYKDLVKTLPDFLKDHALFIAFAPHDKPKIAVAVIVENGEHGSSGAAPLAGEVIKAYMNKLLKPQKAESEQ